MRQGDEALVSWGGMYLGLFRELHDVSIELLSNRCQQDEKRVNGAGKAGKCVIVGFGGANRRGWRYRVF